MRAKASPLAPVLNCHIRRTVSRVQRKQFVKSKYTGQTPPIILPCPSRGVPPLDVREVGRTLAKLSLYETGEPMLMLARTDARIAVIYLNPIVRNIRIGDVELCLLRDHTTKMNPCVVREKQNGGSTGKPSRRRSWGSSMRQTHRITEGFHQFDSWGCCLGPH